MSNQKSRRATDLITSFASWVNEHVVGNPWALVVCILFVIVVFALILVQGYAKWNLSTGLFANDAESAYELITGTASVVAVIALHRMHREQAQHVAALHDLSAQHNRHLAALHAKVDELTKAQHEHA